jgi:glucosyl-dolichyl phosphate glucuronosyltransferase
LALPELSIIVCTHDRPDDLVRCLDGLAAVDGDNEVIVVDSGSDPPCRQLVDRHRGRVPALRYLYEPRPGLSRARNAGIAIARAPLIAFIDDDAVPRPGWARALQRAFIDPQVGCVGGACRPAFAANRPRWLSDRLLQLAGVTRFGEVAREPRSSAEWPFGANLALRARALSQVGPFAPALGRRGPLLLSGEDSDMVARVLASGWRVWLEPAAVVDHRVSKDRCQSDYYWRRLWWNGIGRAVNPSPRLTLRLIAALPLRLGMWVVVRDRVYLYRLAETAGYLAARLRLVGRPGAA